MPELPEVQTTVDGINNTILKRTIVDVWSDWPKAVKKPKDFAEFKRTLENKKILRAWRRAKNVIIDLSGNYSLLIHQKMTGHLLVGIWKQEDGTWKPVQEGPMTDPYNRFLHIIFFLDDKRMLALSDARKFAKIELWRSDELLNSKEFLGWGPEPLEKSFTFEKFKAIFNRKKGKVKQVLMVPEVVAGIGNIYSSEALWEAKINPHKDVSGLTESELKLLYAAIKKVLATGVELGGDSFSDYRRIDGTKGDFDAERKVYQREGQTCYRCGTLIKREKIAQRSAFFCPKCQK